VARLHAAGVCEPVLREQDGLRQGEADADPLRIEPSELLHRLVAYRVGSPCQRTVFVVVKGQARLSFLVIFYQYTDPPRCWSSLLSEDG
jgi:hypothetical protein